MRVDETLMKTLACQKITNKVKPSFGSGVKFDDTKLAGNKPDLPSSSPFHQFASLYNIESGEDAMDYFISRGKLARTGCTTCYQSQL